MIKNDKSQLGVYDKPLCHSFLYCSMRMSQAFYIVGTCLKHDLLVDQ